ncbi:MAG TPA: PEP-CTERM sorting domain-containing protein [Planctomycetia bacterium]|nr:PEP-CTERM sorting domain-containing protein [Planctomycetia bacterium]
MTRSMRNVFAAAGFALALLAPDRASASLIKVCDTQPNIDYDCRDCAPTTKEIPFALFDFSSQQKLTGITGLEVALSMQVADPSAHNLTLALDGIDTGIQLTGFERDALVEKTFKLDDTDANWLSPDKEAALMTALSDGQVFASVLGETEDDLKIQLYSDTATSLCITGPEQTSAVPEPASLLIFALSAAAGAIHRRRRA